MELAETIIFAQHGSSHGQGRRRGHPLLKLRLNCSTTISTQYLRIMEVSKWLGGCTGVASVPGVESGLTGGVGLVEGKVSPPFVNADFGGLDVDGGLVSTGVTCFWPVCWTTAQIRIVAKRV